MAASVSILNYWMSEAFDHSNQPRNSLVSSAGHGVWIICVCARAELTSFRELILHCLLILCLVMSHR